MKVVAAKCPNCGANIEVDENSDQTKCEFCKSIIVVEDAIKKLKVELSGSVKVEDAEKLGYEMEKGRIKAREDDEKRKLQEERDKAFEAIPALIFGFGMIIVIIIVFYNMGFFDSILDIFSF